MWPIYLGILFVILYYLAKKHFTYWKVRGVPGPKPSVFFGTLGESLLGKKSVSDIYTEVYRKYSEKAYVGIFRFSQPCLLIRDLEFIRHIVVKDFKSYVDNDIYMDKDVDTIFGRNPFVLKGEEWKEKRALMITCFTPVKMRGMYPLLNKVGNRMVQYINDEIKPSDVVDAREICVRFTSDNIAACAYGLEGRCFDEPYSDFRELADKFLEPGFWTSFKSFLILCFPALSRRLRISFVGKEVEGKLMKIVSATLTHRRENNVVRNDFLEYVSQLFTEEIDIVAQTAAFFLDGYETSSRVMSYTIFEIAMSREIQEKLREEINIISEKYDNQITYEALNEMVYLEACLSESMRLYPVLPLLQKMCTETNSYTPTDRNFKQSPITVEKGTPVIFPLMAIHRDPNNFENPDQFIPERFMDKQNYNKYAYLPFGEGPRACLGIRFGMTQLKVGLAHLVKNFEITINKKTQYPLRFDPWYVLLQPIGGIWINLKKVES